MPAFVAEALRADGWWLRSEIIWHKPNPMPESCTDRPTSAHEKLFLLAKSGSSAFWTHRAHDGVRVAHEADYVWRNRDTGEEVPVEPEDWRVSLSERSTTDVPLKLWRRVNLWDGHDYFYDADAVRIPCGQNTHARRSDGERVPPKGTEPNDKRTGTWREKRSIADQAELGANLRNVWSITTHGYSKAHFATFPPELAARCLWLGTSERGVCADCGAPWVRQVSKSTGGTIGTGDWDPQVADGRGIQGGQQLYDTYQRGSTTGWAPTCDCGAGTAPAVVLDPFAGACTVGLVAQRTGRSAVLIEISKKYAALGHERIESDMPLLADVTTEIPASAGTGEPADRSTVAVPDDPSTGSPALDSRKRGSGAVGRLAL